MNDPGTIVFYYERGPVGTVETDAIPNGAGLLAYMPFRSASHHALYRAIADGRTPTCTFSRDGAEFTFTIIASPGYGQLEVRDVHRL